MSDREIMAMGPSDESEGDEPLSPCPGCNGLGYERQPSIDRLVRCDTCDGEGWT